MQIEPTTLSNSSTNSSAPSTPNTAQHGLSLHQQHSSDSGSVLGDERGSSGDADDDGGRDDEQLSRLNIRDKGKSQSNKRPSYQIIAEYENSSSPAVRKYSEGPAFAVVKAKGARPDAPELVNFPNEVLTHILSHLPAASLSAMTLVSRRFYDLVTTPHAWRIAFSRFFPGQDSTLENSKEDEVREVLRSERRYFTRLTALASWRSEYILRTRLLRSLGRGRPSQTAAGHGSSRTDSSKHGNAVLTYNSQLFATINHIHAVFHAGRKPTKFIHGTDETGTASISDPTVGKIDNWGLSDPQALPQFADLFIGDAPYGMGDGPVGLPNTMDVSQPFGMIYGEGFPGGQAYFRAAGEMRGRFLSQPSSLSDYESGIPRFPGLTEAISAVWIAKSTAVSTVTAGLVGMMCGSTLGVVSAFSLGADTQHGRRINRGQLTAKWILCPGVPIIQIRVDDSYNVTRNAANRIWAVALNALGEIFYLTKIPTSEILESKTEITDSDKHAWTSGRTTYWHLVEPSRRVAKDDPYHEHAIPGSYSPRSSEVSMRLSKAQLIAETKEIEKFLLYPPSHFREICEGWDMRRRFEVDFAGDDGNGGGEGMIVMSCGLGEGENADIKRYTRWHCEQASLEDYPIPKTPPMSPKVETMASLFGGGKTITPARRSSPVRLPSAPGSPVKKRLLENAVEEWRTSIMSLKEQPFGKITASSIDMSSLALLTVDEDPLLTANGSSTNSSVSGTPSANGGPGPSVPGQNARFLAIGSSTGKILLFNMRGPQSVNAIVANELHPLRFIQTDSPQISCLAVSALYLVHGGNDGLVQAWDPLASTLQPVRVLHSRFSSRARRRLVQAEASAEGVGINLYAAGAIILDPDSTVLRGMVSLGTHLRYWSYSASAADQYQSKKRRLRRSNERGNNGGPDRFTNAGRGALMDYIATEQEQLRKDKLRRAKEEARLRGRFGVGLGGLSEEDALRYAELISAEAFQQDEERRMTDPGYIADEGSSTQSACTSSTVTPVGSYKSRNTSPVVPDEDFEQDIEEAIRLSLLDGVDSGGRSPRNSGSGAYDIPITYKQKKTRRSASSSPSSSKASKQRFKASSVEADDLELALRLSLQDQQGVPAVDEEEDFPSLESPIRGKGKGKAKW